MLLSWTDLAARWWWWCVRRVRWMAHASSGGYSGDRRRRLGVFDCQLPTCIGLLVSVCSRGSGSWSACACVSVRKDMLRDRRRRRGRRRCWRPGSDRRWPHRLTVPPRRSFMRSNPPAYRNQCPSPSRTYAGKPSLAPRKFELCTEDSKRSVLVQLSLPMYAPWATGPP